MSYSTFFSKQARKPSGLFGRFIASRIFEKGNSELNELVKETLALRENDHLLEIGFGTGQLMHALAGNLQTGLIEGIDFSKTMVDIAKKKNRRHIRDGKVKIHMGAIETFPFDAPCFDKIATVNTIYFWDNPEATVSSIHRMLRPGGELYIGFHHKRDMEKMPLHDGIFHYYTTQDVVDLLSTRWDRGRIAIIKKDAKKMACYCAVATK